MVGGERIDEVPIARELPRGELLQQKAPQFGARHAGFGDDAGDNPLRPLRVEGLSAEHKAIPNPRVRLHGALDGLRRNLSAGDVDEVARAATDVNEAVANLGEVARPETGFAEMG